jgi:hypothetical protein
VGSDQNDDDDDSDDDDERDTWPRLILRQFAFWEIVPGFTHKMADEVFVELKKKYGR